MIKKVERKFGEGNEDYPKLSEYVGPVLRQFMRERRDVALSHEIDADGNTVLTIVATAKPYTKEELEVNKATTVDDSTGKEAVNVVDDSKKTKAGKQS